MCYCITIINEKIAQLKAQQEANEELAQSFYALFGEPNQRPIDALEPQIEMLRELRAVMEKGG